MHVDFNCLSEDGMSSFNLTKSLVGFSWCNLVGHTTLIGPGEKLIAEPATTFIGDKFFRNAKVCNPMSFQGCNVVVGLLRIHLTSYLVFGGTVQDSKDGPFLLLGADPEDIGLDGLIEVVCLLNTVASAGWLGFL